jgi:hypothetical protein
MAVSSMTPIVFNVTAVVLAINVTDPDERAERIDAFAGLVENFDLEIISDKDTYVGLRDALPALRLPPARA